MKIYRAATLSIFVVILLFSWSCDRKPYELKDGYMFVQKEDRRNEATEWQLVWEDDFDKG